MAMYIYANAGNASATYEPVMAFTHGDRFKPLAGYQVMAHHYHMDLGERLQRARSLDANIPDLDAIRAAGHQHCQRDQFMCSSAGRPDVAAAVAPSPIR